MGASSEYFIKIQEEEFNSLGLDERCFLNSLNMSIRQLPTEQDEKDEHYQKLKKERIKAWNNEQEYLFKKRNKVK